MYAIPRNSILTPQPGEFDRLAGKSSNLFQRLEKAIQIAQKHQIIIELKGHYTAASHRKEKYFSIQRVIRDGNGPEVVMYSPV
jgi:NAD(P)H-hydrate repair Nnr-like enzyme with NAD(P)H-hydrate dehydratase domain